MINLIGHDNEINFINKNLLNNNLHNSILVHGPKGIGKRKFINKLITNIFTHKNINNIEHHLNLFSKSSHPNIRVLEREIDTKAKKLKTYITIEQIRNIKTFVNETSSISDFPKIVIVDSADDFNINSSNSFLKTLEEPNNNTFIFLISHQLSSLLPTIRSRCIKIKLNSLIYENFKKVLINNIDNIEEKEDEIKLLFEITNGSPGESILLYDNDLFNLFDLTIKCITKEISFSNHTYLTDLLVKLNNDQFKNYLFILKSVLIILKKFKHNYYKSSELISKKIDNLRETSQLISNKNIIARLEFLIKNENDLFIYNLDKRIFMLNFLNT